MDARSTLIRELGGRPPIQIWGTRGMVSSMHPLASQAAADVLREGGNAVDAAIALGGVISVTSPDWAGLAGDSAWLVYASESRSFHFLDGYSTCPSEISADLLAARFGLDAARDVRPFNEEPRESRNVGMLTAMVPGTPAAWAALSRRFGKLPFERLFDHAVEIAERGFPVNQYLALALQGYEKKLRLFESTRSIVCDGSGNILGEGERLRQPDLARTLRRIATRGHDGFYAGETADMMVDYSQRNGGVITKDDLREYRAVWRDVLSGSYRGKTIIVSPPPTAGAHLLQALNILEGFDLSGLAYHGAHALHLQIEAIKLALSDRRATAGDPDFLEIDTARLIDRRYADELRAKIDSTHVMRGSAQSFSADSTTHFVVVDEAGNVVSATQTIGSRFGCGEVIGGTGMFMNDRTWWMALRDSPNQVAPRHRASIGHAPVVIVENDRPAVAAGSPGGFGIVQYMVQVIVNMVDYGLDIQSAIEAPRFKVESLDGRVGIEKRVDADVRKVLLAKGHQLLEFPDWTDHVGGVEGVSIDFRSGHLLGGYDPRRNSMAIGLN